MYSTEKVSVSKSQMYNMCQKVNVSTEDNDKVQVISGQGGIASGDQKCAQGRDKNVRMDVKNPQHGVMWGQGPKSEVSVSGRAFYTKRQTPAQIESLLVRPLNHCIKIFQANAQETMARSYASVVKGTIKERKSNPRYCKGGVFWAARSGKHAPVNSTGLCPGVHTKEREAVTKARYDSVASDQNNAIPIKPDHTTAKAIQSDKALLDNVAHKVKEKGAVSNKNSQKSHLSDDQVLLFDIRNTEGDKFINSIIFNDSKKLVIPLECKAFDQWRIQSDMNFGFIPLTDPCLPVDTTRSDFSCRDPIKLHGEVKKYDLPNYLGARIPVKSQMNIGAWKVLHKDYWDHQLLQCLEFGFPLGFNRTCPLKHDKENHKSALQFPQDVEKYIQEEKSFGAIMGPFKEPPIKDWHFSPFMTRHKPNSDTRRVILDHSWPRGESVNAGVEKDAFLGADFKLSFPSIDDLTKELLKIGKGAHIFKVDVSRAFRHLNVDPRDCDLLGLNWNGTYIDTRIPFGSRHGSQFMQRTSDAVRYVMRQRDVSVINYIDDFLGYGTPDVARRSYDALLDVMAQLGITISEKKLVAPTTQAVCLGILIDTIKGTVAIPDEKLKDIKIMVKEWKGKKFCTKRQLQSLLGTLLYIHKCVKPARCFLNRMLETLRNASNPAKIILSDDFHRDLGWFDQFLPHYNGISMYAHQPVKAILELDACLTGLGGRWKNFVYHLPLPRGFRNLDIVHLEMINIVLALKIFSHFWKGSRVLVKCDNDAVVKVLNAGRARDPYLRACARNIWYMAALSDIDLQYVHVLGKNNVVADLLSRWQFSAANVTQLQKLVHNPVWLPVSIDMIEINHTL